MKYRKLTALGVLGVFALVSAGCASTTDSNNNAAETTAVIIGTTDKVTSLDPAGSYDNGSFMVQNQVFPFLLNYDPATGDTTPVPDIAESAEFTSDTEYTVKLKEGLTFANGHDLTASDVKFTFDRQIAIADENGPSSLLFNLDSTEAPDDLTVVFHLKSANDQTFPQVLVTPAGPIVDEEVFPADALLPDADVVAGEPFAGPYTITSNKTNELTVFEPFADYKGLLGTAKNDGVQLKVYADSSNLKMAVQNGEVDVAYRSLTATDIEDLRSSEGIQVVEGPGGEMRYMVFNIATQPYGTNADGADAAKATAVRQAVASLIDRSAIAEDVYKNTYTPLYSFIPAKMNGAKDTLLDAYGDGSGAPDVEAAKKILSDAGVETPVTLAVQYNPDHYGDASGDEYAAIKSQLEESGLFTVDLQSTEWVQYNEDRVKDVYPVYQLGWFPDYSDADNYLTPFFGADNFLAQHYENAEVQKAIADQISIGDAGERAAALGNIQDMLTKDMPTIPLLEGKQFAVAQDSIDGIVLDASFKLRTGLITKAAS